MKQNTVERGTIFRNLALEPTDPACYFVYVNSIGRLANVMEFRKEQLTRARYLYCDLKEKDDFEVVGYTDGFDIIQSDLESNFVQKSDTSF